VSTYSIAEKIEQLAEAVERMADAFEKIEKNLCIADAFEKIEKNLRPPDVEVSCQVDDAVEFEEVTKTPVCSTCKKPMNLDYADGDGYVWRCRVHGKVSE
jgi:hypothetical protein